MFVLIRDFPKKKTQVLKTLSRTARFSKAKKFANSYSLFCKNVYPYNLGSRVFGYFEYSPGKRRKFLSTFPTFQVHVLKVLFRSIRKSQTGVSSLNKL